MSEGKHTPGLADLGHDDLRILAEELLVRLVSIKQTTMRARRFGFDTLQNYRSACVSAEGDAEDAINLVKDAISKVTS